MTTSVREEVAVAETARAYFEAWFDGDVNRMQGVLHPGLAKRGFEQIADPDPDRPRTTTAERMFELTARGEGKRDAADRRIDVTVVDVHGDIASATVRSAVYHEYLHLVRQPEGWRIVNALWHWT
jgi:ketosteroid isomerase-like protein